MNRYERFCEVIFPDLYKIAHLISGDPTTATNLAVNTVIQGFHRQHSMKEVTDARTELTRILYAACNESSFDVTFSTEGANLASLEYHDRCFIIFRHCSGLRFQDFCRITGQSREQAHIHLARITSAIQCSQSTEQQPRH